MRKRNAILPLCLLASMFTLLCAPKQASAQAIDIKLGAIGPYQDLTRGAVWGATGKFNTDNSYIFIPQNTNSLTCVYVANNNPSSAHSVTLTFRNTGDPRVTGYLSQPSQQGRWATVLTVTDSIPANSVHVYSFSSLASASNQVQVSGTATQAGSPDTADMYVVQSVNNLNCATSANVVAGPVSITNTSTTPSCNLSAVGSAATASTIVLVAAPPAGQFIHVCSGLGSGDVASNATLTLFQNGTAGTCAAPGATLWQYSPHTGGSNSPFGAGLGQSFQTTVAAQPLCFTNGASGATQFISISYTIF
jgi:hypothetical protein